MAGVEGRSKSSHRSRIDIIADILHVAVGGARKTQIMYSCNLSFKQLQSYLALLLGRGLLTAVSEAERSNDLGFLEITDKGQALLKAYNSLKALLAV